jgi:hypothetical protein
MDAGGVNGAGGRFRAAGVHGERIGEMCREIGDAPCRNPFGRGAVAAYGSDESRVAD